MRAFAQRLMMQGQTAAPNVASAIFGTAGSEGQALYAGQAPVRIGLWPVQSAGQPLLAMGLFTLLGFLLERRRGTRVYRLAARVEGEPAQWRWTPAASQFGVDDWQLDGLDDNVGIWGELEGGEGGYRLTLYVEDDRLAEETPPARFVHQAPTLSELVAGLAEVVARIAATLDADAVRRNAPLYAAGEWEERALEEALAQAFRLELRLYLHLWGQPWPDERARAALQQLAQQARLTGEFGAWLCAMSLARWLRHSEDVTAFLPAAGQADALRPESGAAAIIVAEALFGRGAAGPAGALLEERLDGASAPLMLALADLYRRSGRVSEAVDVLQDAIEAGDADGELLTYYGDLLQAMELGGMMCEACVFVDPEQETQDTQMREALAAWEAALGLAPEDPQLLRRILLTLTELEGEDERFQAAFAQLVALDRGGEALRQVIDACSSLESLAPVLRILRDAFRQQPDNLELGLNLAEVLLLEGEEGALAGLLERLRPLARDEAMQAEIARLQLMVEEPEFEMRLGELEGVLDAGNALRSADMKWLEEMVLRAPGLGGMHALLARAWLGWDEPGTALETLLDGFQRFPGDAELATLLGEQLWQAGEAALAFEYLGKGLSQNPDDVPLLALTGQYLFEDGQEAAARSCLARAEALAPQSQALARARGRIAALLAG